MSCRGTTLTPEERESLMRWWLMRDEVPLAGSVAERGLLREIGRIVAERMASAWDEGYALDWTGGAKWANPYCNDQGDPSQ